LVSRTRRTVRRRGDGRPWARERRHRLTDAVTGIID